MLCPMLMEKKENRMKHFHAQTPQTTSRLQWTMYVAALTGACLTLLPQ
jgi:hypothetical protein